jgi:hypothetical protein
MRRSTQSSMGTIRRADSDGACEMRRVSSLAGCDHRHLAASIRFSGHCWCRRYQRSGMWLWLREILFATRAARHGRRSGLRVVAETGILFVPDGWMLDGVSRVRAGAHPVSARSRRSAADRVVRRTPPAT